MNASRICRTDLPPVLLEGKYHQIIKIYWLFVLFEFHLIGPKTTYPLFYILEYSFTLLIFGEESIVLICSPSPLSNLSYKLTTFISQVEHLGGVNRFIYSKFQVPSTHCNFISSCYRYICCLSTLYPSLTYARRTNKKHIYQLPMNSRPAF